MSVVTSGQPAARAERPGGLAEVLDVILDKGIVIDAYVRVTLVGIELLTIDARIVIASIDTYLRFADAVGRLELGSNEHAPGLPGLMRGVTEGAARAKTKGALAGAKETVKETASDVVGIFRGDDDSRRERVTSGGGGSGRGVIASMKEAASEVVDKFRGGDDGPPEPTGPAAEVTGQVASGPSAGHDVPAARGGGQRGPAQRQVADRGAPAERRPPRR